MPLAPRVTVPLPTEELARMRDTLSHDYGNELWERDGSRVLVIRVPRDEPDIVNDLEGAVEGLSPADVEGTPHIVLLGHRRTHIVPASPVKDLMANRIRFDRAQAQAVRTSVKPGDHKLWKAPDDPKRLLRLAIRLPCDSVAQITPEHVHAFTQQLGPLLGQPGYQGIGAAYLVANRDDVRIEAGLFLQDLAARYQEEKERHELAAQLVQKEEAARRAAELERQQLLEQAGARRRGPLEPLPQPLAQGPLAPATSAPPLDLDGGLDPLSPEGLRARLDRLHQRPAVTARAPLRSARAARGAEWEADEIRAAVDALPEPGSALPNLAGRGPATPLARPSPAPGPTPASGATAGEAPASLAAEPARAPKPVAPGVAELDARLTQLGYATIRDPGVHGIDLAAERAAFPMRVVAFAPARLDRATAEQVLAAAKAIDADQAIVVCPEADMDGRRRFIATRARWISPADVAALEL